MKASLALILVFFVAVCSGRQPQKYDHRCKGTQISAPVGYCPRWTFYFDRWSRRCLKTCIPKGPFHSRLNCDSTCRSVKVCYAPRPSAYCAGRVYEVYYFNVHKGRCVKTTGCTFFGNNFPDLRECKLTCMRWLRQPRYVMVGGNRAYNQGA